MLATVPTSPPSWTGRPEGGALVTARGTRPLTLLPPSRPHPLEDLSFLLSPKFSGFDSFPYSDLKSAVKTLPVS